jgi:SAM-dependent methyltransferase
MIEQRDEFEASSLQVQRMETVIAEVERLAPRSVLDVGCGDGELLTRLASLSAIRRATGVDRCSACVASALLSLGTLPRQLAAKASVVNASFLDEDLGLHGFDAITLVEVIEHIEPRRLSVLEHRIFRRIRPSSVVVTTPNHDYNTVLGLPPGDFRHPDHKFEWGRLRFRRWAVRVAREHAYEVRLSGIGDVDPDAGSATQMVVFKRQTDALAEGNPPYRPTHP